MFFPRDFPHWDKSYTVRCTLVEPCYFRLFSEAYVDKRPIRIVDKSGKSKWRAVDHRPGQRLVTIERNSDLSRGLTETRVWNLQEPRIHISAPRVTHMITHIDVPR